MLPLKLSNPTAMRVDIVLPPVNAKLPPQDFDYQIIRGSATTNLRFPLPTVCLTD